MRTSDPGCPPGLRAYQRLMETDRGARLRNQERLRELLREREGEVAILCSHDAAELARYQGRPGRPRTRKPARRAGPAHNCPDAEREETMREVTVAATQMACEWDRDRNVARAERLVRQAAGAARGRSCSRSCSRRPTSARTSTAATSGWPSRSRAIR